MGQALPRYQEFRLLRSLPQAGPAGQMAACSSFAGSAGASSVSGPSGPVKVQSRAQISTAGSFPLPSCLIYSLHPQLFLHRAPFLKPTLYYRFYLHLIPSVPNPSLSLWFIICTNFSNLIPNPHPQDWCLAFLFVWGPPLLSAISGNLPPTPSSLSHKTKMRLASSLC